LIICGIHSEDVHFLTFYRVAAQIFVYLLRCFSVLPVDPLDVGRLDILITLLFLDWIIKEIVLP
jgi:hypothetical protein